ncbi:MAG: hypothetical protein ACK4HW_02585 [Roseinatronobacter sp.]
MVANTDETPDKDILLQHAHDHSGRRIAFFDLKDRRYWLKRPERLGWVRRLQKGNSRTAFRREIALLRAFERRGAPVVPILAEEPDLIVLPDMGPALNVHAMTQPLEAFVEVLEQAARALAELHSKGMTHGRPRLKDICWNGRAICFLDLEAGARTTSTPMSRAVDLLIFTHSITYENARLNEYLPAILRAYHNVAGPEALQHACTRVRKWRWFRPLFAFPAMIDRLRGKKKSEAIAALNVLDSFPGIAVAVTN